MAAHSIEQTFYGALESTFNTPQAWSAGDAFLALELSIQFEQQLAESEELSGSASVRTLAKGRTRGTWSCRVHPRVNASASGTAPPAAFLWRLGFAGTPNTSSKWQVGLSDANPSGAQMARKIGSSKYEQINGCVLENVEVSVDGSGAPGVVTFSGSFSSYRTLEENLTVSGAHSTSDTTIDVESGGGDHVAAGLFVAFASEDNSGSGYQISSISSDTLTISPGLAGGLSGGEVLAVVVPALSDSSTLVQGVSCGFSVDGGSTALDFQSASLSFATGHSLREGEASTAAATGVVRSRRKITGTVTAYSEEEWNDVLAALTSQASQDVLLRLGPNTSNARIKFDLPACKVLSHQTEVPDGLATLQIEFQAVQSSAASDECVLLLD